MLLIKHQYETIYGESSDTMTFDIEWPWKVKVKVTQVLKSYIS